MHVASALFMANGTIPSISYTFSEVTYPPKPIKSRVEVPEYHTVALTPQQPFFFFFYKAMGLFKN